MISSPCCQAKATLLWLDNKDCLSPFGIVIFTSRCLIFYSGDINPIIQPGLQITQFVVTEIPVLIYMSIAARKLYLFIKAQGLALSSPQVCLGLELLGGACTHHNVLNLTSSHSILSSKFGIFDINVH